MSASRNIGPASRAQRSGTTSQKLAGAHGSDLFVCAAVDAGAPLPDLDEPGSTVGRPLGTVTETVVWWTRRAPSAMFPATATRWDTVRIRSEEDGQELVSGGHRHLTHTVPAVVVYGLLAWGAASLGPIGPGVTVAAMSALGLGLVLREFGAHSTPFRRQGEPSGAWRRRVRVAGLQTVGVGALVRTLGDWLTRSRGSDRLAAGVPGRAVVDVPVPVVVSDRRGVGAGESHRDLSSRRT